jgi:hypothetical protein
MSHSLVLPDWLESAKTLDFHEQGFNERADAVMAADGSDLNEFWAEIQSTIALRNRDRNRLISAFTTSVSDPVVQFSVPSEVDFEEASEYGQPVSIRGGATRFWRGFDFKFYDLAIRYTWMFIAEADAAQLRMLHSMALDADNKLLYQKVMKCLFNPINTLGTTDQNEPITAYKFYNADGEVPPTYKTNTFNSSHNHYVTSGGATLTSANVTSLINELGHHGYTMMNNYQLVLWMNPAQVSTIKAFRVATGAEYDFIPNTDLLGGGVFVPNNGQYVGAPQGKLPGEVGTYGPFHIVQEDYIPAGYIVALASGGSGDGPGALRNPIGIREHKNPAYRGLKIIPGSMHTYPLLDSYYRRGFGTGITQRGGGVVMQVTASGSYTVPAQYA